MPGWPGQRCCGIKYAIYPRPWQCCRMHTKGAAHHDGSDGNALLNEQSVVLAH